MAKTGEAYGMTKVQTYQNPQSQEETAEEGESETCETHLTFDKYSVCEHDTSMSMDQASTISVHVAFCLERLQLLNDTFEPADSIVNLCCARSLHASILRLFWIMSYSH